jgi:hypothetical protein
MAVMRRRQMTVEPAGACTGCHVPFTGNPFEVEAVAADHCDRTGHEVRVTRSVVTTYTRVPEPGEVTP